MKIMWCWRCKQDVAMLDENEYALIHKSYGECMERAKDFRKSTGNPLKQMPINEFFKPVSEEYERITGFKGFHHNAIIHHRLLNYGPPCKNCGKPLRTPRARICAFCSSKAD